MSNNETEFTSLNYQREGAIVKITLDRPAEANGLNTVLAKELAVAAQQCADDSSVKAVILTGNGRFFCAGGDVKSMVDAGDNVASVLKGLADNLHKALAIFAQMDAPLIVAVNGTAAGAGFSMAVAGDMVLAAESANFTMAYTKVGLSPDGSSSYYLPRLIGLRKAQELMFTNRVLSANEALEWGLINKVVPDEEMHSAAQKLAEMFAKGAKGSNASIKSLLQETYANDLETQMALEGKTIVRNSVSDDGQEGINAFVEKRKPEFS